MLGNFITRILVYVTKQFTGLALGYAYPAFECFKTIEKNKVEVQELIFWCQYWIITALVTVFERFGDIFISWLPFYGEMKLVLFIYLWYPKTKGTGYIYGSILKPYMAKHEPDIDRNLQELKTQFWDLLIFYALNCSQFGQTIVFQIIQYLTSHAGFLRQPNLQHKVEDGESLSATPSPPRSVIFKRHKQPSDKGRPPIPPPSPMLSHRSAAHLKKSDSVKIYLREETKFVSNEGASPMKEFESNPKDNLGPVHDALHDARLKLRRTRSIT